MKKLYFLLVLSALTQISKAQVPTCSLNPTFIAGPKNGVYPDSLTNFVSGTVGQAYVQNITVKVPLDTIQTLKFCFNRVVLSTPTNVVNYNLPPGLLFGSSTAAAANGTVSGAISLKFPGNANNCASIYGTPTTAGTYTLKLQTDTYATLQTIGNCTPSPNVAGGTKLNTTVLGYYIITILPPAGINEVVNSKSLELTNIPNPFTGKTIIKFNVKDHSSMDIKIRDVLGKTVFTDIIKTKFGENTFEFDGSKLNTGIYFYTISYKNYSETKRMIIASN
ncbi:MAG: T9SS type A sorting domain-containing protein [Bacteroidota bacterium]|nr:T9SS type A sorting domain-containing protein [Bacteroidota bacterium]